MKQKSIIQIICLLVTLSLHATDNNSCIHAVKLIGQEVEIDVSNEFKNVNFVFDNVLVSSEMYGEHTGYAHVLKDNIWNNNGVELEFFKTDRTTMQRYAKGYDSSLLRMDIVMQKNMRLQKLTIAPNMKSIADINNRTSWKVFDLSTIPNLKFRSSNFALMPNNKILLGGAPIDNWNHILTIVDYKNNKLIPLDYWPNDGIDTVNAYVKNSVYTDNSQVFTNGCDRYLYKMRERRFAFIFTIDGDKVNILKYLYSDYPKYKSDGMNKQMLEFSSEEIRCSTTNEIISLLLLDSDKNGAKLKKIYLRGENKPWSYGNVVELYDWNGNKRNVIYLDHYGQKILLSDDGRKLYLFFRDLEDNSSRIWVYDLSNLDKLPKGDAIETENARAIDVARFSEPTTKETEIQQKKVNVGDTMIDFELYDYDDNLHHLNEFVGKNKYTILEFSGISCGPCQAAKPMLERLNKQYKDKFEMVTISIDHEKLWKKKPVGEVGWHEWNDHKQAKEIMKAYGVYGIPTFFIISPFGKIEKKCLAVGSFMEALKEYIPAEDVSKIMKE